MLVLRFIRDWRVLTALVALVVALLAVRGRIERGMVDFEVYRTAAHRAVTGETLYQETDLHWKFKYLPAFAFAIAPVALLPAHTGRQLWFGFSLWLLVVLIVLSFRLLPARRQSVLVTVGFTVLVLLKFYAREISLGQTNILLAVLVLLGVRFLVRGNQSAAGVMFAAATIVKPYAIVFLAYLALRKRVRAAVAFTAVLAGALILPALVYGTDGNWHLLAGWWRTVTGSTPSTLTASDNISLAGLYAKWLGPGPAATQLTIATTVALAALCGYLFLMSTRVQRSEYLDAAVLLTIVPLLSPQGWDYVLLAATPAVMLLAANLPALVAWMRAAVIAALVVAGLTLWDLVGPRAYGMFMAASVVTVCYLFAVAGLVDLRRKRIA